MIYVLYHAGCADGFGAALAAWLCLGEEVRMDGGLSAVRYWPVQYGKPVPAPALAPGCTVYLVDFCYDLAELRAVAAVARSVVVLDHHPRAGALLKRAQEEMAEALPGNVEITFDNEKSGAVLAWEFFFPREPVPVLLRYVQDRDLWQWRLPESREVSAALASYPKEFAQWGRLLDEDGVEQLREEGRVALRVERQMAERLAKQWASEWMGEIEVPSVNTAVLINEVCHELLTEYGFKIAACWYEKEGRRIWSLRSRADVDCSVIAKRYGGGGHPQACGFEEPAFVRSTNDTNGEVRVPWDETTRFILGRPSFALAPVAHRLREMGHDIPCKCEAEQAHAMHWLLGMYAQHGTPAWLDEVNEALRAKSAEEKP